jgi:hypothetical protein
VAAASRWDGTRLVTSPENFLPALPQVAPIGTVLVLLAFAVGTQLASVIATSTTALAELGPTST